MNNKGHLHPITALMRQVLAIFNEMGFELATGPELEEEFYNFDALNVPKDHPARDMQDTFWIKTRPGEERKLLRTHTSPIQIRYMKSHNPPFKIIAPGKVFRNEATDATHEAQFHQIEGLYVDKNVSMAHLKSVLTEFLRKLYGADVEIRFRPSFFGFVEPGVEVDMRRNGKWMEICGAGLVHPNVISSAGLNPEEWQGFAFGFGFDRIVMLKFGIDDVRKMYDGDLRMINQF